jgi:hypothetical protein
VFLSGPGDVEGQFVAAQRVIEAFNRVIGPQLGMFLRSVRGLTDAQAGRGRPQSRINPLVKECDLFVAVFDKRYGSPTGAARSGTEEEFKIASRRARSGGVPHVLLFFRELREADLKAPDLQLRRVLQFKRAIDAERKYYRVTYGTRSDFQMLFFEQLMQWVWNVMAPAGKTGKRSKGRAPSVSKMGRPGSTPTPGKTHPPSAGARK